LPHEPDSLFRALSDPTRRALFERLCAEGELTVHSLTEGSGVSQPAVSKHLAQLKAAGLVLPRPAGREIHYRADPAALAPLTGWLQFYTSFWDRKLDGLHDLLKRMDQ
jgi:DNA-binding transcriptional ArsR family regulator